ncbi:hypothetical protein BKA70DRAFT_1576263 [Coprinopsis sp. MPI-PUGE-AT-0042]|nr:hypothetical protein BKA70DRAFT_1576263 [Coprinopsis sp. MPI-PUGE-AT-0042]
MSSEQPKTPKESRAKKWLRRLRGGSPSPAALASAPSTPQSISSTGSVPLPSSSSSLAAQHTESEVSSQFAGSTGNHEKPVTDPSSGFDVAKDCLNVTGSFLKLVLKKVPDAVDSNPVKVAFSLAKAVLELKEGMDDNTNNAKKRIFEASELLGTVEEALNSYEEAGLGDETGPLEAFRREVGAELVKLVEIRGQSRLRSFAVQEEDEQKIVDIFDSMDSARKRLMLSTTARIHEIVASLKSEFDPLLRQHLKASAKADHDYSPTGEEKEACTGFRVKEALARPPLHAPSPASSNPPRPPSRAKPNWVEASFAPTRPLRQDIQLQLSALSFINWPPSATHSSWRCSSSTRGRNRRWDDSLRKNHATFIAIDALDELEGEGGIEFLGALFEVINQHKLKGLKSNEAVYRLEEVPVKETSADIELYLREHLTVECATDADIQQLVEDANGLSSTPRQWSST